MNMIYKNGKVNRIVYIGIFLILFLSAGFTSANDLLPNIIARVLWIILIFMLAIKSSFKCNIRQLCITAIACLLIIINAFLNDWKLLNAFMHCLAFICVLLLVNSAGKEEIMKTYTNVMYHLCIISLICLLVFWLVPGIREGFLVTNAAGNVYSDIYVFSFNCKGKGIPRNQGMFWEPGAFSTFIVFALVFETINEKLNFKRLVIFLLALLTTFSTTGYFTALAYALFLVLRYRDSVKNRRMIIALLCMAAIVITVMWDSLTAEGSYSVFGKLTDFKNSGTYGKRVTSVSLRIDSLIKPIGVFFQYPIFGCGPEKLNLLLWDYTRGMNTCTFVNWFAIYGLLFGIIMFCGIVKTSHIIANKMPLKMMVLLLLLMAIMTENFVNSPVVFMVVLLGYDSKRVQQQDAGAVHYSYPKRGNTNEGFGD